MKTIESKINSIVDKILKEELSTKVNSAVKRVNKKLEVDEENILKKMFNKKEDPKVARAASQEKDRKENPRSLWDAGYDYDDIRGWHMPAPGQHRFDRDSEDGEMKEDNNMGDMYLGIGDHGFYDKDDRQMKDFDFDYDEEEYDDFDEFVSKYPNQNWFPVDDRDERPFDFKLRPGRKFWDMYKEKFGGPYKLRKRRPMGEEVDEMEENYKVAKERKSARMEKNEELKGNQDKIDKNKNGKIDAEDFKMLRKDKKEKPRTPAGFEHGEIVSGYMKESKKKTIQLTEDEVIELIQRMVMEEKEQNSIKITNKNLKDSKKEND